MSSSPFRITPTPPTSVAVDPGREEKLSFTVENLAAPDQLREIVLQALLIGDDGKGREVAWLAAGPERTLRMSGGQTETLAITVRPTAESPRGRHRVKLRVADQDRPNDVYVDSPPVECEVRGPARKPKPPSGKPPAWLLALLVAALLLGLGGALGALRLGCGGAGDATCIDCPAGPAGPPGPRGPAGPAGAAGPSLRACRWLYNGCNSPPNTECAQVCPRGTHPVTGSCDITAGGVLSEHRASVGPGTRFPPSNSPYTAFDRWVCEASTGRVQFTYALCCAP